MNVITDAYHVALTALAARLGVGVASEVVNQRLRDLQVSVKRLRTRYRDGREIAIEYANDLADAYSFAYFPPYAAALHELLHKYAIPQRASSLGDTPIRICVLAAGPAPEVFAVDRAFRRAGLEGARLDFVLIDNRIDSWKASRNALIEATRTTSPNHISTTVTQADLTDTRFLDSELSALLRTCHIVIMQNCLNEFAGPVEVFSEHFSRASTNLPPGGIILCKDLSDHPGTLEHLNILAKHFEDASGAGQTVRKAPGLHGRSTEDVPKRIQDHLLTSEDGLIPRLNVKAHFIACSRSAALLAPSAFDPMSPEWHSRMPTALGSIPRRPRS